MKIQKFNEQWGNLWDEANTKAVKSYMRNKPKDKVFKFSLLEPFDFSVMKEDDGWNLKSLLTRYDVPYKLDIDEF